MEYSRSDDVSIPCTRRAKARVRSLKRRALDLGLQALQPYLPACTWRERGKREHEFKIVVGGDTIETLEFTAQTAMYQNIFSIWTLKASNGLHL